MFDLNESPVEGGGKKKNTTNHTPQNKSHTPWNILHGNTEVVGVLSGREEIREVVLAILYLKSQLFIFLKLLLFPIQNMLADYKALEESRYENRHIITYTSSQFNLLLPFLIKLWQLHKNSLAIDTQI